MKDQRKTEIKVGITVIVGIFIFLWILGWAKNISITSSYRPVLVKFDNVTGLELGDNVLVNGLRKGFVKDMEINEDHVLVTLSINKDVDLRDDAQFSISMLDLMGGKKVGVFPVFHLNHSTIIQSIMEYFIQTFHLSCQCWDLCRVIL